VCAKGEGESVYNGENLESGRRGDLVEITEFIP